MARHAALHQDLARVANLLRDERRACAELREKAGELQSELAAQQGRLRRQELALAAANSERGQLVRLLDAAAQRSQELEGELLEHRQLQQLQTSAELAMGRRLGELLNM